VKRRSFLSGVGASAVLAREALAQSVGCQNNGFCPGVQWPSFGPVPGSSVSPGGVASPALWLQGVNYNATTGIWTDSSGNGVNFNNNAFPAFKPTLTAGAANGNPAVTFNGTNQFLVGNFGFSANYFTAFIVGRQTVAVDYPIWISEYVDQSTNGNVGLCCDTVANSNAYGMASVGFGVTSTTLLPTLNQFDITTWSSVGTPNAHQLDSTGTNVGLIEIIVKRNGGLGVTSGIGRSGYSMTSPGLSCISGAKGGVQNWLHGQIAEIIFYNRLLSSWEIAQVETYLGTKYNITLTLPTRIACDAYTNWTARATPAIALGTAGQFDVNALTGPSAVYSGGTYYVTYVGLNGSNQNSIGIASGSSPTSLTKYSGNPILSGSGGSNWDGGYVSGDRLYKDPVSGNWYLLYFGSQFAGFESSPASIGIAGPSASPFGPWTNAAAPILSPGTSGAWDDSILYRPFVIYLSGTYYLYYNARKVSDSLERIGYATATSLLGPWTKYAGNPVVIPSATGTDTIRDGDPYIIQPNGTSNYIMFFFGSTNSSFGEEYLASSPDLINWTKYSSSTQTLYMRNTGFPNLVRMSPIWPSVTPGTLEAFCDAGGGTDGAGAQIYYMTLPFGF